jgi:uncharacterized linocin/CFP29 family protein
MTQATARTRPAVGTRGPSGAVFIVHSLDKLIDATAGLGEVIMTDHARPAGLFHAEATPMTEAIKS